MFRELGYGVLFFLSACAGAAIAAFVAYRLNIDFPKRAGDAAMEATLVGAVLGSIAWLVFKRLALTPRKR
jgi:hypothetical protein